ncbi:MAG TPA: PhoH family protein [Candidatus Krumholzibacteria bacterium]|nr:PhoH family protein [Candidatus Krumholzibacteria bacterium]HPD71436.1 PhoH family protein [Candidatus Krumholzibacteria bacterium]HRY41631.1 PhoH family protein [Candidatus Krumholzibacteria bacterium]
MALKATTPPGGGILPKIAGRSYLLDTNVLLHDANALKVFSEHNVILTIDVLEELDRFKRGNDERARNARHVARSLDSLRDGRPLSQGVELESGGKLYVFVTSFVSQLPDGMDRAVPDNRILAAALALREQGHEAVFVSKDINARCKADALGIKAEDYRNQQVNFDDLYTGWSEHEVDDALIDAIYAGESLAIPGDFRPNEGVLLKSSSRPKKTARGIWRVDSGKVEQLKFGEAHPWGLSARNLQQHFALELLLRPDIQLVTMLGQAGTGKTLLALAVGLQLVVEEKQFRRIMVSRPIMPLGRDIGYLPGSKEEKLESWMEPILDNLQYLVDPKLEQSSDKVDYLFDTGYLEMEAVTYIRGRSLPKLFIIIDEAQNLTPHEVKTVVSRAGEGAKVVLTGDAYQIDNPYLDASSNGLTYVIDRFREQALYGHITLAKSERSVLASLAAELL